MFNAYEYKTFLKVLSNHGIKQKGCSGNFKLSDKDSLEIMIVSRLDRELNTSGKDIMIMECTGYK